MGGKPRQQDNEQSGKLRPRKRREMGGFLGGLPLPGAYTPQVPQNLVDRVTRMLNWFKGEEENHPLLREDKESWRKENLRLLEQAEQEAGEQDCCSSQESSKLPMAFAKLVKRDPRYLGTEFGALWLLDLKLQVLEGFMAVPAARWLLDDDTIEFAERNGIPLPGEVDAELPDMTPQEEIQWNMEKAERAKRKRGRIVTAKEHKEKLSEAVLAEWGPGIKKRIPDRVLLGQHKKLRDCVQKVFVVVSASKRVSAAKGKTIARQAGVPLWVVRRVVSKPGTWKKIASEWHAKQYSLGPKALEERVRLARRRSES